MTKTVSKPYDGWLKASPNASPNMDREDNHATSNRG
jgi:hypothetical protein